MQDLLSVKMVVTDQSHAPPELGLSRETLASINGHSTMKVAQKRKADHGDAGESAYARKRPMTTDPDPDSE